MSPSREKVKTSPPANRSPSQNLSQPKLLTAKTSPGQNLSQPKTLPAKNSPSQKLSRTKTLPLIFRISEQINLVIFTR